MRTQVIWIVLVGLLVGCVTKEQLEQEEKDYIRRLETQLKAEQLENKIRATRKSKIQGGVTEGDSYYGASHRQEDSYRPTQHQQQRPRRRQPQRQQRQCHDHQPMGEGHQTHREVTLRYGMDFCELARSLGVCYDTIYDHLGGDLREGDVVCLPVGRGCDRRDRCSPHDRGGYNDYNYH